MGEVNDAAIKKTQDMLGKIIKKPPLTDKLLARPPFRFLHDIMTSIIRGTGFMKGLFTEEEMNSEAIKEKEQKIAFLQKVIDIVALATGKKLSVKPSKVVAGLDADKTNELLQALAEAVAKSAANNDDLVKQVLGGGGGERVGSGKSSSVKSKDQPAARESSADKTNRKAEKDGGGSGGVKEQKPEQPPAKEAAPAAKDKHESRKHAPASADDKAQAQQQSSAATAASKEERKESRQPPAAAAGRSERSGEEERAEPSQERRERSSGDDKRRERARDKDGSSGRPREAAEETSSSSRQQTASASAAAAAAAAGAADAGDGADKALVNGSKEDEDPPANRIPRPSSAKGSRRRHREEDDHGGADKRDDGGADATEDGDLPNGGMPPASEPRRLVRPSSARPAPPRVKKQDGAAGSAGPEQSTLQERVDSGKRVANLITETGDKSDDDDTFIVQDGVQDPNTAAEAGLAPRDAPTAAGTNVDDGEHGGLVKKILETKKEFEGKQQQGSSASTKGDTGITITEAAMKKERELIQREVDKLRTSIQTLTRSANPLGKVMDYVQEDVDAMHKELLSWKKENRELAQQLRREQSVTDSSVEPLRVQLGELEQTIADRLDLIAAVKHNIARNDEKIEKMLSTISRA